MKFLVLAYGTEQAWKNLSQEERDRLLHQDDVLRSRGDVVAALGPVRRVQTWNSDEPVTDASFLDAPQPLAGCGLIEAESYEAAIELVRETPCAVAGGAVEVRALLDA